jgi:hypothetical protein
MRRFLPLLPILLFVVAGLVPPAPKSCCCTGEVKLPASSSCCGSSGSTCCIEPIPPPDAAVATMETDLPLRSEGAVSAGLADLTEVPGTSALHRSLGCSPPGIYASTPTLSQLSILRV